MEHATAHRKATGRPSIKNTQRKAPFFKITTSTVLKKLCIINAAAEHSYNYALDTYYPGLVGEPRMTAWKRIYRWEQNRAKLEAAASQPSLQGKKSLRAKGTSTTLTTSDEESLSKWVNELRDEGIPVSNELLQTRALEIARDIGLGENQFKASILDQSRSGQADINQGEATLAAFSAHIREIVETNDIDFIYNADQTGINYEYIPKKTIDKTGTKTVWIKGCGHDKVRLTAMLLADTNGVKYPLFLVLKSVSSTVKTVVQENLQKRNGFGCQVWREIEELQERHPSRIFGNPTAWWNSHISMQFLSYHFGHRRGKPCKPVLLLWDDFSAHFTSEVCTLAKELNAILEKIPPRFTWICQPADVSWVKPMKTQMRRRWVE
ncbi:hypothetical protein Ae201684P_017513 [Aphanomyces euteiches]|nr:hypothetical protein Ae201684P_017513 [Aphanomyces euteiches]